MHGIELQGNKLCKNHPVRLFCLVLTCKMLHNHFKEFHLLWPSAYLALHFTASISLEVLYYSE